LRAIVLALAAIFAVSGCSCGDSNPTPPGPDGGLPDGGSPDGGNPDGGFLPDGGPVACIPGMTGISITPADSTQNITNGSSPIQFTATGSFASGPRDVTSQLAWSATRTDDTPPGSISGGLYQPNAGGTVTISATDSCVSGQTNVTLQLDADFNDPGGTTTGRFDAGSSGVTTTGTKVPTIVYPNDQTRFPRNIYKVLFQWRRGGDDFFKLTFAGPNSTTTVWTDGNDPQCAGLDAGCWQADQTTWTAIAGSNAGAVSQLTVDGVAQGDSHVYEAPPISLGFSKKDVKGAIFYWSTSAAGIRRASVSDALPEPYVVAKPTGTVLPNGATVQCVACHTVSRSGQKLFAGTQTNSAGTGEFVYDVTPTPPPNPVITTQISTQNKGFGAFSPDDSRVVATNGTAIDEYDAVSGARLTTTSHVVATGTNPDWSPANSMIAYSDKAGDSPNSANLSTLAYLGNDSWSTTPKVIVASNVPAVGTNLFPSFSADGHWIAYAHGAKGGHGDKTFLLYLVDADGGTPVELANANHKINNDPTLLTGQFEDNMPTWAPSGDLEWVAFNSARPYGVVAAAGAHQQIWVAAIDPAKLGTGQDPSYPAFRFAFQVQTEDNHRAFWSQDVRDIPDAGSFDAGIVVPPDAGACFDVGVLCDPNQTQCCAGLSCNPPTDGGTMGDCEPVLH
jgi:hypothetical protein